MQAGPTRVDDACRGRVQVAALLDAALAGSALVSKPGSATRWNSEFSRDLRSRSTMRLRRARYQLRIIGEPPIRALREPDTSAGLGSRAPAGPGPRGHR